MGGRRRERKGSMTPGRSTNGACATLREETSGKKSADPSSILRVQHLQRLAAWAGGDGGVPPLAALLGERLAANAEASGVPLDPSTLLCQRCESVLQPGFNCTIRVKIAEKLKRAKKPRSPCQNNVVYTCHFCRHPNMKRGTSTGHVRSLLLDSKPKRSTIETNKTGSDGQQDSISRLKPTAPGESGGRKEIGVGNPMTLLAKLVNMSGNERKDSVSLSSKRYCAAACNASTADSGRGANGSRKRRRKGWSTLKEKTEKGELESVQRISNFVVPFLI